LIVPAFEHRRQSTGANATRKRSPHGAERAAGHYGTNPDDDRITEMIRFFDFYMYLSVDYVTPLC
jgi:hypothetical protein